MPPPNTVEAFLELVEKSRLVEPERLQPYLLQSKSEGSANRPKDIARQLLQDGLLTEFQARQLLLGKWRGFLFGKYKVLEQLGTGGTGTVFLCEHTLLRRLVALKVLPVIRAQNDAAVARFYREARAAAALNHPNIVRAFDVDREGDIHYIVMEFVDGASLYDIVRKHGPMDVLRACHYIRQAACGLQHIHENRLIHRDIKPGNLLLDRQGTIKILDLGLARFFADAAGDSLTTRFDNQSMMGTADYIAPEQAMDLHSADIRADIYSLGASFYYLLAGRPPFDGKTATQKLIQHQTQIPTPVVALRPAVPQAISNLIDRMLRKRPDERFQTPAEVMAALEPWTTQPIPPPPEQEMPQRSAPNPFGLGAEEEVVLPRLASSSIRRLSRTHLPAPSPSGDAQEEPSSASTTGRDALAQPNEAQRGDPTGETSVEPRSSSETHVHPVSQPPSEPEPTPTEVSEREAPPETSPAAPGPAAREIRQPSQHRPRTVSLSLVSLVLMLLATGIVTGLGSGLTVWFLVSQSSYRPADSATFSPSRSD